MSEGQDCVVSDSSARYLDQVSWTSSSPFSQRRGAKISSNRQPGCYDTAIFLPWGRRSYARQISLEDKGRAKITTLWYRSVAEYGINRRPVQLTLLQRL